MDPSLEAENLDPQVMTSPSLGQKKPLKRKSQAIKNRRMSQDEDSREHAEEDSQENITDPAVPDVVQNPRLQRRAMRSTVFQVRQQNLENDSNSKLDDDDSVGNVEVPEKENRPDLKRRTTRHVPASKAAMLSKDSPSASKDPIEDVELTSEPHLPLARIQKRASVAHKDMFRNVLGQIKRAPTPRLVTAHQDQEGDEDVFSRPKSAMSAGEVVEDAELSFHPRVESTRVMLEVPDDDDVSSIAEAKKDSPKASSRKRSASRLNKSNMLFVSEDDRGSYVATKSLEAVNEEPENEHLETSHGNKSDSQLMPPPVNKEGNAQLDSVLTKAGGDITTSGQKPVSKSGPTRRRKKKDSKSHGGCGLDENLIKMVFEETSGLTLSKAALQSLKQMTDDFMDDAMKRLQVLTGGRQPLLGDYRDLFTELGFIGEGDVGLRELFSILEKYLDDEELYRLVPMAVMDGSVGGKSTVAKGAWDKRAKSSLQEYDDSDDDLPKVVTFGGGRKKTRNHNKQKKKC